MITPVTTNVRPHQHAVNRWGSCLALACALHVLPVYAAFLEGEAVYRERIMPPPDAVLVVSLQDTSRADAPATELGSVRIRLAGGPPYRWRLEYDESATAAPSRPVLRAKIETPAGLWMTTDTSMPAFTPAPRIAAAQRHAGTGPLRQRQHSGGIERMRL